MLACLLIQDLMFLYLSTRNAVRNKSKHGDREVVMSQKGWCLSLHHTNPGAKCSLMLIHTVIAPVCCFVRTPDASYNTALPSQILVLWHMQQHQYFLTGNKRLATWILMPFGTNSGHKFYLVSLQQLHCP